MSFIAVATIGGSLIAAKLQSDSAKRASKAQTASAQAGIDQTQLGIDEARRQFDTVTELLAPYTEAGTSALGGQLALAGLSGDEAQQAAIQRIEQGPQFQALTQQGENAILQNASATGGLRGGNTQAALAQFRPQVLSGLINQQFSNLGGLAGLGQSSAARTGQAAQFFAGQSQTGGAQISNLLAQQGAAQAGGALAQGQIGGNLARDITGAVTRGLGGGFGNFGGATPVPAGLFGQVNRAIGGF